MDHLINELSGYLRPSFTILRCGCGAASRSDEGIIQFNTDLADTCPNQTEFDNMLEKRLSVKYTPNVVANLVIVAKSCLFSRRYDINHLSLSGITEKDMLKIWSTLERSKVTSSPALAAWITTLVGSRSYDGFSKSLPQEDRCTEHQRPRLVTEIGQFTDSTCVGLSRVDNAVGPALTVKGAMIADAEVLTALRVSSSLSAPRFHRLLG